MKKLSLIFLYTFFFLFLFAQLSLSADTLAFTNRSELDTAPSSTLSYSTAVSSGSVLKISGTLNFAPDPSAVSMRQSSASEDDSDRFIPE
ncbi:MAG: hypothetical protein FWC94_05880, partial [Bacteroidales bacterium]|nr:hypothetical protein [Bacteroidales bacterium]